MRKKLENLIKALDPNDPRGLLVIQVTPRPGHDAIVINESLVVRVTEVKGKYVKLSFRDINPEKYNMIERAQVCLNRLIKETQGI